MPVLKKKKRKMGRPSLGTEDLFRRFGGKPKAGHDGWSIYFAKESTYIPVNRELIDNGEPKSPPECVMGLAVNDYAGRKYEVEVACTTVRIIDEKKKKILIFSIPAALRRRLRLFDTMSFWDLPPALYRIGPALRPKKNKIRKAPRKGSGGKLSIKGGKVVGGSLTRVKKRKKSASPTRFVSRGRIVWPAE